jgi:cysteine desulfurase / selenocysteine lyase
MHVAPPAPGHNPARLPPRLAEAEADALIRAEFVQLRGVYLDVAARGPLPLSARRAADAVLRAQVEGMVPKAEWLSLAETVRAQAATLIGAQPEEVAFTKNASEGLNIVGAGLGLGSGDRIVVAPSAEHPNNVFPWLWQAQERGAEFVSVVPKPGEALEAALIRHIDARTRLVAVTAVDFGTGRRTDLTTLGNACRAQGAFLLVDAAQSSGVLVQDMASLPVDAWATAVQKGLLGLYGLGLLYVRRESVDRVKPMALARFSVDLAEAHEAAGPDAGWHLRAGAGRYEVGNYNYSALASLNASLDLLLRVGRTGVERRAVGASERLRGALEAMGVPLLPVPPAHRSHILSIAEQQGGGHDRSEIAWINALSATLTRDGVAHSVRRGALRLSTHIHVLPHAVDSVIGSIEAWQKTL